MNEYPAAGVPEAEASTGATDGSAVVVGLTPLAHDYLDQTRPWVRFMSIVVFVMSGLMVLLGIAMLAVSVFGGFASRDTGAPGVLGGVMVGGLLALLYVALAFVYVAPGLYLARYASAIKRLKTNFDPGTLEDALKHQKSFWRFVGILTAIGLVLSVVGMVLAVVVGVIAAAMAARP
jgi:vacuolar-type H+-ATPase subunit I/STV1